MEQFTFIKDYNANNQLRKSFNELATSTFEIDFEPWYQQGFWNERYKCYSFLDQDKVVSNVSINLIDMIIEGEVKRTIQIGTVMTHPEYRKKGLASRLMDKVFGDYENDIDLFFLFTAEENFTFYRKHGFKPVQESTFDVEVSPKLIRSHLRKLSLDNDNDKQLLMDGYANRNNSRKFDIINAEHILGFYAVYGFGEDIYYIKDLDAVVIYENSEEKLHLYGLFSKQTVLFNELISYIATEKTNQVVFHFTPDFADLNPKVTDYMTTEDAFYIRSAKITNIETNFKFPLIAHA